MPLARSRWCVSTSPWISVLSDCFRHPVLVENLYNKEAEGPDWTGFAFSLWNGGWAVGVRPVQEDRMA